MDCSLPGSSVHGIFQARVLEWGAIAFSEVYFREFKKKKKKKQQCNVKVIGRQPAQTCLEKEIFFKCLSALGLSYFCWLKSVKMACNKNRDCYGT